MRTILAALLLALAASPVQARGPTLDPYTAGIGFAPANPGVMASSHPLFHGLRIEAVQGMPDRVGSFALNVARRSDVDAALTAAFSKANMLAPTPGEARARLTIRWQSFELPFRIGLKSRAMVTIRYELRRIDTGQMVFSRTIVTEAEAKGGNAVDRARGTGRAAIAANIASAIHCLDLGSTGPLPRDCTLRPTGSFEAPIVVPTWVPR